MIKKDYHKGVKLQCYVSEELNDKINDTIERVNKDRAIYSRHPIKYTRTKLINESIEHYLEHINS